MASIEELTLVVTGMTCSSCASHVALAAKTVPGVKDVNVFDWKSGQTVALMETNVDDAEIVAAIKAIGYGVAVVKRQSVDDRTAEKSSLTPIQTDKPKFNWRKLWLR